MIDKGKSEPHARQLMIPQTIEATAFPPPVGGGGWGALKGPKGISIGAVSGVPQ